MTDDSSPAVVIERTLDAPIALVWQMWTEPEHFAAWYGPDGVAIPVARLDVRVGGTRLVCMEMQTPDGPRRMWFTGEHLEVSAPRRLVYTESMADEHGNVLSPAAMGMPPGHPETTTVTIELEDLGSRTRLVLTHAGVPSDSPGAAGWNMALDKLASHLRAG
jgi:uncharacterized protein YndB with AHSA1/START domain